MGLLTGALAKAIFAGFKGKLLKGELRREIKSGGLDEYGDPIVVEPVYFSVEGFVDRYNAFYRASAGIPETDLLVSIFSQSSPGLTPRKDDKVLFNGVWYQLKTVGTDPATALFECQSFVIDPPIDAS